MMKTHAFLPVLAVLLAAFALPSEAVSQAQPRNTNQSRKFRSVIGGGAGNFIPPDIGSAVIAGGRGNTASSFFGAVGGGRSNSVTFGNHTTVGGGFGNAASSGYSTVAGGEENTANSTGASVGGGRRNTASGLYAVVAGGVGNTASGNRSAVPGGEDNTASGAYSFAAGRRAKAAATGSFVWADSQDENFNALVEDAFMVRARGGVSFDSGAQIGIGPQKVSWVPGSGSWAFVSDVASKEGFRGIDAKDVLRRVAQLPVSEWNYIGYPQRHIGPTAQDWHAAFPLNESEKTINTADMHGVSLAAIKGLVEELRERDKAIDELKSELSALRQEIRGSLPPKP